jgi:methionyl-tRNA synthetase
LLDLLAIDSNQRGFEKLGAGARITAGSIFPPPSPVFPRYVEAEDKA